MIKSKSKSKSKLKQAFSFVEIMFAVVCVGLLLVPVYSIFSQGSMGAIQSRNEIIAQQHAANLLSFLSLFPYDHKFLNPTENQDFKKLELELEGEALNLEPEAMFSRRIAIKELVPDAWQKQYKLIIVTLNWKEAGQKERELKICGIKFK